MIVSKTQQWIKDFGGAKVVAGVVAKAVIRAISGMVQGFAKLARFVNTFEAKLVDMQSAWLAFNHPIELQFDDSEATKKMDALAKRRGELYVELANKSEFVQDVENLAKEIESTVKVSLNDGTKPDASAVKNLASANNVAADSATKFAEILKEVNGSSVWQDIFKKEEVTARSNQFDDVARNLRNAIDSGSSNQASLLNHLKQIVETASKNKQVFTNEGTFGAVDIKGMTEVLLGLTRLIDAKDGSNPLALAAEKLATSNAEQGVQFKEFMNKLNSTPQLANVELAFMTDTGRVAGKIFAEPEFISNLKSFHDRQQSDGTRADSA